MVDLTNEEIDVLKKLIMTAPIQGTLQTLPTAMNLLAGILEKLDKAERDDPSQNK